jgi:hypothetical protein
LLAYEGAASCTVDGARGGCAVDSVSDVADRDPSNTPGAVTGPVATSSHLRVNGGRRGLEEAQEVRPPDRRSRVRCWLPWPWVSGDHPTPDGSPDP